MPRVVTFKEYLEDASLDRMLCIDAWEENGIGDLEELIEYGMTNDLTIPNDLYVCAMSFLKMDAEGILQDALEHDGFTEDTPISEEAGKELQTLLDTWVKKHGLAAHSRMTPWVIVRFTDEELDTLKKEWISQQGDEIPSEIPSGG